MIPSKLSSISPTPICHDNESFFSVYDFPDGINRGDATCKKLRNNAFWRVAVCNIDVSFAGETKKGFNFCPEACGYDCSPTSLPTHLSSMLPSMSPSGSTSPSTLKMPSKDPSASNHPSKTPSQKPSKYPSKSPTPICHDTHGFRVFYAVKQKDITCEKLALNAFWRVEVCHISVSYQGETKMVNQFCPEACRHDCSPTALPTNIPSTLPSSSPLN